jgi:type IV secretory pathway TrbD component
MFRRLKAVYRFWSTDERFKWGARNQFVVMAPVAAGLAIFGAVVQQWLAAFVFGLAAAYMGNWLLKNRARDDD